MRFDCERVMRTDYEIDHYQRIYFVLSGYDDLPPLRLGDLDRHIAAIGRRRVLRPAELIDGECPHDAAGRGGARRPRRDRRAGRGGRPQRLKAPLISAKS